MQNKIHGEQRSSTYPKRVHAIVYFLMKEFDIILSKGRHEDIKSICIENVSVTDVTNAEYTNEFYQLSVFCVDSDWNNKNHSSETTKERVSPHNQWRTNAAWHYHAQVGDDIQVLLHEA